MSALKYTPPESCDHALLSCLLRMAIAYQNNGANAWRDAVTLNRHEADELCRRRLGISLSQLLAGLA